MQFSVTNALPEPAQTAGLDELLLKLFCAGAENEGAKPFSHQVQAFRRILDNQALFLVAGTASGKTLAVGVPLFYKLQQGAIRKVLLMYPTIALLEDQRRVMELLAKTAGLDEEMGQLQGGMTRSALIHNLNKRVLLATPDEIYWFFRKNVKYSSLLIYGLALVDELVLDEAHLFNGLMLRNFEHLWRRIQTLAHCVHRSPRLHILTATPTESLKRLNQAEPILGKSKCQDVHVEFRPSGRFDRTDQITSAVNEALAIGQRKVLVVCNSARTAHQLFEKYKIEDTFAIPVKHRLRFGKVMFGDLIRWLGKVGLGDTLLDASGTCLLRDEDVLLANVPENTSFTLPVEDVVTHATDVLERQCWYIKRALLEKQRQSGETWESLLHNRPFPCSIIANLRPRLERTLEAEKQRAIVDEWLTDMLERLGNIANDSIPCTAPDFASLVQTFTTVGLDQQLASLLVKRMIFEMKADQSQLPTRTLSHRPVYLRSLDWIVDAGQVDNLCEMVRVGLESGELNAECRHIGLWKGADVPVIVYSGSMAKQARTGLINVFADVERAVLISTSAVEVGVDFHADTLITEECEGKSFLQRFGRVGRHTKGSQVIALVTGDTYASFDGFGQGEVSREGFSDKVTEVFPHRDYAAGSQLLDASHYLINEQLGRIGERLNATAEPRVIQAAEQLRAADIQLGFGLRSTMPQITLCDGVTKDPFYLLRYVDDHDLHSANSPFEVARADTWFTSLIFQRVKFDVIVNLEETLKASLHVFVWGGSNFRIWSQPSAGIVYLAKMNAHFAQAGRWDRSHQGNFLLLHGDVYLSRVDRETPHPEPVCDWEQNLLFIPNQIYLVLWGWTDAEETRKLLQDAKIADWEELHYDWDALQFDWTKAMVILERTTGACFAAYKELVDYVNRSVQS